MYEAEEETHSLIDSQHQPEALSQLDRVTCDLRKDLKHKRRRRLDLVDIVNRVGSEREKDRSEFAFLSLQMSGNSVLFAKS